jgi:deoxyhypusine synthase
MSELDTHQNANLPPERAKDAVFVASDPVPEGTRIVQGFDFNLRKDEDVSVVDLVDGMSDMGFQASAMGDAVRIINEMVRANHLSGPCLMREISDASCRGHGRTKILGIDVPSSWATLRI